MAAVVNQYTTLLLSSFTDFEIGNYYAAVTFSSVLGIVTSSISSSLLSTFSRTLEGGIERMLKLSVKYSSLLIMPTTISLIIFSEDFVRIFFGSKYKLAPFYLSLLLLSYLPVSIGSLSIGSLLSSLGRIKIILIVSSLSYSIFLPLSYLLSKYFWSKELMNYFLDSISVRRIRGIIIIEVRPLQWIWRGYS
jgi:O-antigen/teichoic acid export membrane protein